MFRRLLCAIGLHHWSRGPNVLGEYGMGLEWFETWTCTHCPHTFDQLQREKNSGFKSPQYGWRTCRDHET